MPAWKSLVASSLLVAGVVVFATPAQNATPNAPLAIQEQGSFAVGGTVVTTPGAFDPIAQGAYNPAGNDPKGQTLRGDHAYVFYQVPVNARRLPLVFSARCSRARTFGPSCPTSPGAISCSPRVTRRRP